MATARRQDNLEAVERIVELRRAERRLHGSERAALADAREFLERVAGPTVRPAEAARLLGVSRAALHRWIERGEVATVLTSSGRREVPRDELVSLLEEVGDARARGAKRPLGRVLHERQAQAEESIDLNRLLPQRRSRDHRFAELNSLAYHRAVAERLDDRILDEARRRLSRWKREGSIHPHWAEEWERILGQPADKVAKTIAADTPRARELRQTSPFTGVLTEQERRRLRRALKERVGS